MSGGVFWKQRYGEQIEQDLSSCEKALRDEFARQYLLDYDPKAAAIRCGFNAVYADQYAKSFMEEPYTRQKISELSVVAPEKDKQVSAEDMKHRITMSLFREANYRGAGSSHGARVSALSKLASINGLDAPIKTEQTVTHRGGVMAVPGIVSIDEWERVALASQEKLSSEAEA